MKYNIDDEIYFKYQNGNDEFITKGIIIAYSENMTYYPTQQSHIPIGYGVVGSISNGMSISLPTPQYSKVPGYQVITNHPHMQMYYVPEFEITGIMKKESFKKELEKLKENT